MLDDFVVGVSVMKSSRHVGDVHPTLLVFTECTVHTSMYRQFSPSESAGLISGGSV